MSIETYSIANWKKLPQSLKQKHKHSFCLECAITHPALQEAFPGPTFKPTPSSTLAREVELLTSTKKQSDLTRYVLAELQPVYEKAYGTCFTESVSKCKVGALQQKPTKAEKRKGKRKIQQECRDYINSQMRAADALNVLTECQSLKSYKRHQLSSAFETPEAKRQRSKNMPPSKRKHSPKFEHVQWDKDGVLASLREWPIRTMVKFCSTTWHSW